MFDIDYMLNGSHSRQRHQELINEAQKHRQLKQLQNEAKQQSPSTIRRMIALINLK